MMVLVVNMPNPDNNLFHITVQYACSGAGPDKHYAFLAIEPDIKLLISQ